MLKTHCLKHTLFIIVVLMASCRSVPEFFLPVGQESQPATATRSATAIIPSSTPKNQVNIPLSIEVIGSPTPNKPIENEQYPGFSTVVTLPNDILLPGEINNDGNLIDSLAVFGIGGGGGCGEISPTLFFDKGSVSGCSFQPDEQVIIELIRPDDSVVVARLQDDEFDYCFDSNLLLQPGRYTLRVTTNSLPVETHWFSVSPSASPLVFLSGSSPGFYGCTNIIIEGQPTQIFYEGFQPDERFLVALYYDSGNYYEIIKTWPAQVDSSGRLVEEILAPQVVKQGKYGVAVFGQNLREVSFGSTDKFYASFAARVIVNTRISSPSSYITSATITPRPAVPTLTPSYVCPDAPEPRVKVDDSIRVTFTDGTPLRVRSSPEVLNDNIVELIPEGTRMKVLDGPKCEPRPGRSDSFVFWKVRITSSGLQGWVAEGDLYNYYIEKIP